jgi:hypothetical protein
MIRAIKSTDAAAIGAYAIELNQVTSMPRPEEDVPDAYGALSGLVSFFHAKVQGVAWQVRGCLTADGQSQLWRKYGTSKASDRMWAIHRAGLSARVPDGACVGTTAMYIWLHEQHLRGRNPGNARFDDASVSAFENIQLAVTTQIIYDAELESAFGAAVPEDVATQTFGQVHDLRAKATVLTASAYLKAQAMASTVRSTPKSICIAELVKKAPRPGATWQHHKISVQGMRAADASRHAHAVALYTPPATGDERYVLYDFCVGTFHIPLDRLGEFLYSYLVDDERSARELTEPRRILFVPVRIDDASVCDALRSPGVGERRLPELNSLHTQRRHVELALDNLLKAPEVMQLDEVATDVLSDRSAGADRHCIDLKNTAARLRATAQTLDQALALLERCGADVAQDNPPNPAHASHRDLRARGQVLSLQVVSLANATWKLAVEVHGNAFDGQDAVADLITAAQLVQRNTERFQQACVTA